MSVKMMVKQLIKNNLLFRKYLLSKKLYRKYLRIEPISKFGFLNRFYNQIILVPLGCSKADQLSKMNERIKIIPSENKVFFYSLDCFTHLYNKNRVFDNYTVDYDYIVNHSFAELQNNLNAAASDFGEKELKVIESLKNYVKHLKEDMQLQDNYGKQIKAIESLFDRPSKTLFEALQRILFFNQFLWQTQHSLNGLGRMDRILGSLYQKELERETLDYAGAKNLLKNFFEVLHDFCWFKSNVLMGDTGQIIILGGKEPDGSYFCNDLTYMFIEVSKELKLPDPKIFLRCTADMPTNLLMAAAECISTGIGAPLLSNDDEVIPAMISYGFSEEDAYNYCTAACWEPLIPGISCDANNIASLNFAVPLIKMFDTAEFDYIDSMREIIALYISNLKGYIKEKLTMLTQIEFEEDPLLSLISKTALEKQKDITRGGAKYNNIGLTSVGLSTVVNSCLNIEKLVFDEQRYSLAELNKMRKENFIGNDELVIELKNLYPAYGSDEKAVVDLTKYIMSVTSREFSKYSTKYGGKFKFGLSSPSYIDGAREIPATLDGRKSSEPFGVHISSVKTVPTTELLSFAMKLDYRENRLNGNVIDFFTTPNILRQNVKKYVALLRAGFAGGIFQLQMNVVDSKTLIAAKADPQRFPDLVVRVWGFSAYFNDLPKEYKDVLIARAIESEKAS